MPPLPEPPMLACVPDADPPPDQPLLTIVIPCLNEAETLERCIEKARAGLADAGVPGEIVIADNGSTDGSDAIAERCGARVVRIQAKGYGNALRAGIRAARGAWIVMGDADDSYDFSRLRGFAEKLAQGYDLVMGCRLPSGGGTILPGAMPWKNRWIGNPSLSLLGRILFRTPIRDFHCGLRAFTREAFERMDLRTTGMEFASEMVMKASLWGMKVSEVPITLHPDGRSRPPHLRPWRDGWRHLRFMLLYSPRWLFLAPGLAAGVPAALLLAALAVDNIQIGGAELEIGAMLVAAMVLFVAFQLVTFAVGTKAFAVAQGLVPDDPSFHRVLRFASLERGIALGFVLLVVGTAVLCWRIAAWASVGFGHLSYTDHLRPLIVAATLIVLGTQTISSAFFLSALGLAAHPAEPPAKT